MHDFMKLYTGPPKFEFGRVEFASGGPSGPPVSKVNVEPCDFSSETTKRNSTKLDRKQDLNVLYQVCVFRADWKNKMAALASDWLRHFRLLL